MLESGALSDEKFPAFAKNVIPYLHITTKIEGKKYDGMLQEKGFRGFPTLAYMDAEGNVLHQQGDRSVAGFETSLVNIPKLADLEKRVADGEKGLEFELLMARWEMGKADYEEILKVSETVTGLNDKQKAKLSYIRIEAEIVELAGSMQVREGKEAAVRKAGKRLREIVMAGHKPSDRTKRNLWSSLMQYGEQEQDAEMYAKAVDYFKKMYADEPRAAEFLKGLEEKLAEMKKGADAKP